MGAMSFVKVTCRGACPASNVGADARPIHANPTDIRHAAVHVILVAVFMASTILPIVTSSCLSKAYLN